MEPLRPSDLQTELAANEGPDLPFAPAVAAQASLATAGDRTYAHRILLVEDEAPFRELLEAFLAGDGFAVHAVPDGRAAAAWLSRHAVDVIVTDLCMPDRDGMQLMMQVRKTHPTVPVIVMSGGVGGRMAGMLRAAELLGARRTLSKPFALRDLADAVRRVMTR